MTQPSAFNRTHARSWQKTGISAIHCTTKRYDKHTDYNRLLENTTGSSPVMSTNRSSQSSSHVFAYPSSNRTSRFWRMLTVAIRSSRTESTQYGSSVIVEWIVPRIANGFPTQLAGPTRNGCIKKLSSNLQLETKLTVGEWDKRSGIVCEFSLRYGTRELH